MERDRERKPRTPENWKAEMRRMNYEVAVLRAIAAKNMKKRDVAVLYMALLVDNPEADMKTVHKAIIAKWSCSGLYTIRSMVDCEIELVRSKDPRVFLP